METASASIGRGPEACARSLGLLGVPSFVVGTEVFWGHDRMKDAFDWAFGRQPGA